MCYRYLSGYLWTHYRGRKVTLFKCFQKHYMASALAYPTRCLRENYFEFLQLTGLFLGGGHNDATIVSCLCCHSPCEVDVKGHLLPRDVPVSTPFQDNETRGVECDWRGAVRCLVYVCFCHETCLSSHALHNDTNQRNKRLCNRKQYPPTTSTALVGRHGRPFPVRQLGSR